MPILERPDVDLWYERIGSGQQVVFCNGSGASIDRTRPLLDLLAAHLEVAVHDQRCLGRSGIPATQPSMADYAADVAALIDHLGWERPRVVGISFGGMVAQEFAVSSPERVDRLALLCTSPGGDGGSSYPLHEVATLPAAEQAALQLRLLDGRFDAEWLAEHPADKAFVEAMAARPEATPSPERLRGHAMQLEARRHHDVWDRLTRITCPTVVMCGAHDLLAPPSNSAAIVSRLASAEMRSYDGGHLFLYQDRAALPDLIEFLTR